MRRSRAVVLVLGLALAAGVLARPAAAQSEPGGPAAAPRAEAIARADSLLQAERVEDAMATLDERLRTAPDDFEARWRAARAAVTLGILASGTDDENAWFRRGVVHAERALMQRPDDLEAMRWALAAKGHLAVQTGLTESARLGQEVWDLAQQLLRLDPASADARYALGKLEYELLKLNRVQRLLSRPFRRGELANPSWTSALTYHERAVELDPDNALYRLGLADTLWRLGRRDESVLQLERARDLPIRGAADRDFRARAELLLRRVERGIDPTK